jgi:hypothetical protein
LGYVNEFALQTGNSSLQSQVNSLQTQLATVQSNKALKLGPFVDVDPNPENGVIGPNIKFTGANIHILSGSGATDDKLSHGGTLTGLGNLIIGYDEASGLPAGARGGSHNLVIGTGNSFTSSAFGGLVAGENNTVSNAGASVSGGFGSDAEGEGASVSGGNSNIAAGFNASAIGGSFNRANGDLSVVLGGTAVTITKNSAIRPQPPFSP